MRRLVRLAAKRGALVLDPFVGSGTTSIAALAEGWEFVGIDSDAEYLEIAELGSRRGLQPVTVVTRKSQSRRSYWNPAGRGPGKGAEGDSGTPIADRSRGVAGTSAASGHGPGSWTGGPFEPTGRFAASRACCAFACSGVGLTLSHFGSRGPSCARTSAGVLSDTSISAPSLVLYRVLCSFTDRKPQLNQIVSVSPSCTCS